MHLLYSKTENKKINITWSNSDSTIPHISLHPSKKKKAALVQFCNHKYITRRGRNVDQQQTCSSSRTISIYVSMDKKSFSSISS